MVGLVLAEVFHFFLLKLDQGVHFLNGVFFSRCLINTIRSGRIVVYHGILTGGGMTWWHRYSGSKNHSWYRQDVSILKSRLH